MYVYTKSERHIREPGAGAANVTNWVSFEDETVANFLSLSLKAIELDSGSEEAPPRMLGKQRDDLN
jgi:hypothetical protein